MSWYNEHVVSDTSMNDVFRNACRTRSDGRSAGVDNDKSYRDRIFMPIRNQLLAELKMRGQIYRELHDDFHFLVQLPSMKNQDIRAVCKKVCEMYKDDVNEEELTDECEWAKCYLFADAESIPDDNENTNVSGMSHAELYARIIKDKSSRAFPNIETLLRIYLCFFITNCTDERAFSRLKRIKTYLRNSLSNESLNSLALMCIERNILNELDFNDIIDTFINKKRRRMMIAGNN